MSFEPNWASPPGATIQRLMVTREIDADDLADGLGLDRPLLSLLLEGNARITPTLASALADQLGSTPRFWLTRDKTYLSDLARLSAAADTDANWVKAMPVASMRRYGWITRSAKKEELREALLSFFDCTSLPDWNSRYSGGIGAVAFRRSFAFEADEMATLVWLRAGERQAATTDLPSFNPEGFVNILPRLRKLSVFKKPSIFLPRLTEACRSVGVAVTTARAPDGCRASGATWKLASGNPIIHLSFRHRAEDHFWFTFFHEAGHVVMHGDSHLDLDGSDPSLHGSSKEEMEANLFAQDYLLPREVRNALIGKPNPRAILRAAKMVGVSPGIIVGQLEKAKALEPGKLSRMKHRYRWDDNPHVPELTSP
ncbi:ImmA/IrrE family metallo-endopeptidase [Rhizobium sp. AAP43]|uniref:ImmA/IrrE family metallo-endopeptidase n=1 Tax=Rhizobium sp. AAP43 TaxID=1523420 RepID=UPI0006B9FA35|nr:ImmA/IrrE family metallo-endopeptidase [Rhizobium sp. AAP43]